jgi:hypothetical protein
MNRQIRRGVVVALVWFTAAETRGLEDLAARVAKARQAARANAASASGREWMHRHSDAASRLMIPILNGCVPEPGADIPTAFSLFLRLSEKGRVREVVTELDAGLGTCMTAAAGETQLPEPPRDDYWIQLNMATDL